MELDEEKKKRKSAVAVTTNNFLLFCVKRNPTFYETILNKTEVDYYEKNHLLYLERRTLDVKYCHCSMYCLELS